MKALCLEVWMLLGTTLVHVESLMNYERLLADKEELLV